MMLSALSRDFLRYAGYEDLNSEVASLVDTLLAVAIANARASWPTFSVSDETVILRLAQACASGQHEGSELPDWVSSVYLRDLYLACALEAGNNEAIGVFVERFVAPAVRAVHSKVAAEELQQMVLERVLVAAVGHTARIRTYEGKGPLGGWIKAVVARIAINARATPNPIDVAAQFREVDELSSSFLGPDVELAILSGRYRQPLRVALSAALAALSPRDRTILRFHFLEGVSGDSLARMYGVSRRTISRWIEDSRSSVLVMTRQRMSSDLQLSGDELEEVVNSLRSQLESVLQNGLAQGN